MSTCTSGKRCTVIRQVRWCMAVQTLVNCHCELKENSIRDVEPVELVVQQLMETMVKLPGSTDNTCSSIQHVLQFVCDCFWCTCNNSIAVINPRVDAGMDESRARLPKTTRFTRDIISCMRSTIEDHLMEYLRLHGNDGAVKLRPKHHLLVHLPTIVLKCGPLVGAPPTENLLKL